MDIIYPKAFQIKSESSFFEEYLAYLEQIAKRLKIENKNESLLQIQKIINRVKAYEKILILEHISLFSLKDLQAYFHMDEKLEAFEQCKVSASNSIFYLNKYSNMKRFYEDKSAMLAVLKTLLNRDLQADKDFFLDFQRFNHVQTELAVLQKGVEEKKKKVVLASQILHNPCYESFFKAVGKKNKRVLFQVLDFPKHFASFWEIEKNRLHYFIKIVALENVLDDISFLIVEKKKNSFWGRRKSALMHEEDMLKAKYKQLLSQNQKQMQERKIDHSTRINYLVKGINEETQVCFLKREGFVLSWENFVLSFIQKQEKLIKKLYSFSIDREGFFHFETTKAEREQILEIQQQILAILDHNYFIWKQEDVFSKKVTYDLEKKEILESLLGVGNNLSRETLANFIYNNQLEIQKEQELIEQKKQIVATYFSLFKEDEIPFYTQLLAVLEDDFKSSDVFMTRLKKL